MNIQKVTNLVFSILVLSSCAITHKKDSYTSQRIKKPKSTIEYIYGCKCDGDKFKKKTRKTSNGFTNIFDSGVLIEGESIEAVRNACYKYEGLKNLRIYNCEKRVLKKREDNSIFE